MMKKIILCLFLALTTSCSENNHKQIIKMGTSPDYPPFEFKKNGEIVGFDIALAKEIAKKMNKELIIQELDFNSLIPALQSGKLDFVASGLTITSERAANVDFSNIYFQTSIAAIAKEGVDITNFSHKKIGAQLGSLMEAFAKEKQNVLPNITVVSLANNLHLLQELKLGRIDILLLEQGQIKEFLRANPGLISYVFPKSNDGYAFAFSKNSELKNSFNEVLKELDKEGFISDIASIWIKQNDDKSASLWKSLTYIPKGIFVTLEYALISVFFGLIIGVILSFFNFSSNVILKFVATAYLSIFRGTPLLLQLFIAYFLLPSLFNIEISAFAAGIIAFSLNSGAYVSEIIRAGVESVDRGQFEAAKSLGMPYKLMMFRIIMPQAIRNILPSLVNEAINMIKESSIISVIGEADIMRRANIVSAEQYSYFGPLLTAGACYYILVNVFSLLAKLLEKRLNKR